MNSCLVTAPDIVNSNNHKILIRNIVRQDLETVFHLLSNHDESFVVYVYNDSVDNNPDWLDSISKISNQIFDNADISAIVDYFIQRANERTDTNNTL
jgi:hypothetical protein